MKYRHSLFLTFALILFITTNVPLTEYKSDGFLANVLSIIGPSDDFEL